MKCTTGIVATKFAFEELCIITCAVMWLRSAIVPQCSPVTLLEPDVGYRVLLSSSLDPVVSESSDWRSDNLHCAQHPLVSTLLVIWSLILYSFPDIGWHSHIMVRTVVWKRKFFRCCGFNSDMYARLIEDWGLSLSSVMDWHPVQAPGFLDLSTMSVGIWSSHTATLEE